LEDRSKDHQKLTNDLTISRELNNQLKQELQRLRDQTKTTNEQQDILTKDLIKKLETQEEKEKFLEDKLSILSEQNSKLQKLLEEGQQPVQQPDLQKQTENEVLLESLRNEREAKHQNEAALEELRELLERVKHEKQVGDEDCVAMRKRLEKLASENRALGAECVYVNKALEEENGKRKEFQNSAEELQVELARVNEVKIRLQNSFDEMVSMYDKDKEELRQKVQTLKLENEKNALNANEVTNNYFESLSKIGANFILGYTIR